MKDHLTCGICYLFEWAIVDYQGNIRELHKNISLSVKCCKTFIVPNKVKLLLDQRHKTMIDLLHFKNGFIGFDKTTR